MRFTSINRTQSDHMKPQRVCGITFIAWVSINSTWEADSGWQAVQPAGPLHGDERYFRLTVSGLWLLSSGFSHSNTPPHFVRSGSVHIHFKPSTSPNSSRVSHNMLPDSFTHSFSTNSEPIIRGFLGQSAHSMSWTTGWCAIGSIKSSSEYDRVVCALRRKESAGTRCSYSSFTVHSGGGGREAMPPCKNTLLHGKVLHSKSASSPACAQWLISGQQYISGFSVLVHYCVLHISLMLQLVQVELIQLLHTLQRSLIYNNIS